MKLAFCFLAAVALGVEVSASVPPVQDGLAVHFDVREQARLRQAGSLPPLAAGASVDRLLDGTDGAPPARQFSPDARPHFQAGGGEAFLRFDGADDFLSLSRGRELSPELTVFVLAAPRGNPGGFSALFATAEAGQNDYTSGLNIDFGPRGTDKLSVVNVESAGAGGFRDFLEPGRNLAADLPFGGFRVFTVRSQIGGRGNEVYLDGIPLGDRTRLESNLGLDEMMLGARLVSNDPLQAPFAQGFFEGDIAAVLVYRRALDDDERKAVEQWLSARRPILNALASGGLGHALEPVADPPVVQMLVPGFGVEELPVRLTNLTSIRYRHDEKLVALGYDGRLHLLSDTDGDGTEDRADIFWDQSVLRGAIGIALLPENDPRGDGVFVASKGRVSLIVDRDRDGIGDEEIVVATGWKENFTNVDATGLAVDPVDGSIYFCLGVENFANAYLVDPETGESAFDLATDRGTIQRVTADFSKRETVSTGVRFACSLEFNRFGDLFATEQEGATWLPNGNPYDELLHIVPGRHYGFPPRHPRHLAEVIDEPSTFDYGPQHQSTVGMVFNDPVNGGPTFGPAFWDGDALICGQSRGKLYRTKLAKSETGYVAQNSIIACLELLTVDACVSPRGDLVVACHSGPPDWGTGPAGEGRIFRIRHEEVETPQPVLAWAATPGEFRIAFDKPLDPSDWAGALAGVKVEAGAYVSPGDRFEVIRPGYQVVREQLGAPRRWVEVLGLSLTDDRRTLVLRIDRQAEDTRYAVTLPVPESWRVESAIAQRPEMDVAVTLHGVLATAGETPPVGSSVVLPHPALAVAEMLTEGSAEHATFFQAAKAAGSATLTGTVTTTNVFVPDTQPGSTLDWNPATDSFASRKMTPVAGAGPLELSATDEDDWHAFELEASAGDGFHLALGDGLARPLPLHRVRLPWASSGEPDPLAEGGRDDVHGDWLAGRRLYFGKGSCVTCHTLRSEGVAFGPDLTNLVHRDRASVLADLLDPSSTINPDQTGSLVRLKGGAEAAGIVRQLDEERLVLALPGGATMGWARSEVESVEPLKTSLMPAEFAANLTDSEREDLLTFLLTVPLEPTPITRTDPAPPAPRRLSEIGHLLPQRTGAAAGAPLRILLSADEKDHGIDEHDYPLWLARWSKLLDLAENVSVATCTGFPASDQLAVADVVVFYSRNAGWNLRAAKALDVFQQRGGGLVYLHWAMEGGAHAEALAERIGLATSGSAYRHGEVDLVFPPTPHPITRGFESLHLTDETYWNLRGDPARVGVLATSVEEGSAQPQIWTLERGSGRVFGCIPGHYMWTFDDPLYRLLVLRGIVWAAGGDDLDRLAELATVGARVAP
ncbi:hypothetical protein BH23VER1_BH23VER1_04330 [soil metagenome]